MKLNLNISLSQFYMSTISRDEILDLLVIVELRDKKSLLMQYAMDWLMDNTDIE